MKYSAFHFDLKTYLNYGDSILFELVRQTFNTCNRRESFLITKTRSLRRPFGKQTIEQINKFDLAILGGGGLFLKDTVKNSKSGWQWQCSFSNLEKIQIPLVLFAVGNNRFIGQEDFGENFVKHLNKTVEKSLFVGLRNHGSILTIKQYLRPELRDRIKYQPCPTTISSYLCPDIFRPIPEKKKKIAFNVIVGQRQIAAGFDRNDIYSQILQTICFLEKDNWEIEIVAHNRGDLDFYKFLRESGHTYKVIELFGNPVKEDLYCGLKYYSNVPFVFGIRGHAGMISFGMGGIPFTAEIHHKLKYFQSDIGLPDYCMNPKEKDWGTILYHKITDAYKNYYQLRAQLDLVRSEFFNITINNLAFIYSNLEKTHQDSVIANRIARFIPYSTFERKMSELMFAESFYREKYEYGF